MRNAVIIGALVLSFATFVTAHVALAARLSLHTRPRWRGLAALFLPPLAPIWAAREGWRGNTALWMGSLAVYVLARIAAEI